MSGRGDGIKQRAAHNESLFPFKLNGSRIPTIHTSTPALLYTANDSSNPAKSAGVSLEMLRTAKRGSFSLLQPLYPSVTALLTLTVFLVNFDL